MNNINIVNLTPHKIRLYKDNDIFEFESQGIARCTEENDLIETIDDIPVYKKHFGEVYDLPEPKENTIYIVSFIVARAVEGTRSDVYTVSDTVRDDEGRIIGFRALSKV